MPLDSLAHWLSYLAHATPAEPAASGPASPHLANATSLAARLLERELSTCRAWWERRDRVAAAAEVAGAALALGHWDPTLALAVAHATAILFPPPHDDRDPESSTSSVATIGDVDRGLAALADDRSLATVRRVVAATGAPPTRLLGEPPGRLVDLVQTLLLELSSPSSSSSSSPSSSSSSLPRGLAVDWRLRFLGRDRKWPRTERLVASRLESLCDRAGVADRPVLGHRTGDGRVLPIAFPDRKLAVHWAGPSEAIAGGEGLVSGNDASVAPRLDSEARSEAVDAGRAGAGRSDGGGSSNDTAMMMGSAGRRLRVQGGGTANGLTTARPSSSSTTVDLASTGTVPVAADGVTGANVSRDTRWAQLRRAQWESGGWEVVWIPSAEWAALGGDARLELEYLASRLAATRSGRDLGLAAQKPVAKKLGVKK